MDVVSSSHLWHSYHRWLWVGSHPKFQERYQCMWVTCLQEEKWRLWWGIWLGNINKPFISGERSPVGSPMWDSIPGPWGHALTPRQTLNHWAPQAPLYRCFNQGFSHTFSPDDVNNILFPPCKWWAERSCQGQRREWGASNCLGSADGLTGGHFLSMTYPLIFH